MYFPASLGDEFLYRNRPSAKFVALTAFLQVFTSTWGAFSKSKSHRSICQLNATASKQFVENLHNFIKPYNSANLSPPGRSVFEGRKSHRSICQFNFYNFHRISPKLLKSIKPYNSANPSPLDQHVFEGRRSHRSIALFTFY